MLELVLARIRFARQEALAIVKTIEDKKMHRRWPKNDIGNRKRKIATSMRKLEDRLLRNQDHRLMTQSGVPRRIRGSRLGHRRRELIWAGK